VTHHVQFEVNNCSRYTVLNRGVVISPPPAVYSSMDLIRQSLKPYSPRGPHRHIDYEGIPGIGYSMSVES